MNDWFSCFRPSCSVNNQTKNFNSYIYVYADLLFPNRTLSVGRIFVCFVFMSRNKNKDVRYFFQQRSLNSRFLMRMLHTGKSILQRTALYTNHCRGYSTALLQTKSEFQQQQKNTSSYVNTALSFHFLVRNFLISNLGNLYCQLTFTSVRRGTNSHTRIPTVMLKGPFSTAVPAVLAQRHW